MKFQICNIQRFSLHDGDGIRTTIFLKGCPLNCPWCCNPENKIKHFGKMLTIDDIVDEVMKDYQFYGNGGGVTFSGGEPLLHYEFLNEILPILRKYKLNTCIETSLFVDSEIVKKIINQFDEIIVDVKSLEDNIVERVLGGDIDLFNKNLDIIKEYKEKIIIRTILVKNITYTNENLKKIKNFLLFFKPKRYEIFSVHNVAKSKYFKLNLPFTNFEIIEYNELEKVKNYFSDIDVEIKINAI